MSLPEEAIDDLGFGFGASEAEGHQFGEFGAGNFADGGFVN